MIKAVIFDCFGVLTSEGWIPFRDEYFGADPEKLEQANMLMRRLVTGQITDEDFHIAIADLAQVGPERVGESLHANIPDEAVFAFIRTLKPTLKTAMLSNVGKNRLHEIFTPDHLKLIDIFALSSETGYVKPDERAYRDVAERLGVLPAECIFVDDQPVYVEGARKAGMQAMQFCGADQCVTDVKKLLANTQ